MMRGLPILTLDDGVTITVSGMGYMVEWPMYGRTVRIVNYPTRRIGHA